MTKKQVYKSEASEAIHDLANGLFNIGLIDKTTMRNFDESCLVDVPKLEPTQIRQIRERERLSQSVSARYLNISPNQLSEWERGVKKPSGAALKLLSLVQTKGVGILV